MSVFDIDRAALAAAKALSAAQPQANLGSILPSLAGAAASFIPGVGPLVAPIASGLVGSLVGGGGSSSGGQSGSAQQALGSVAGGGGSSDPLFQGLNAAQAAALVQAAAKGNAAQTAGLVTNALGQVGTNTSTAQGNFAQAVAGLGPNPALASGIHPATLGAAPRISGIGNTSSVGAGGVNAPGAPGTPDYGSVLAALSAAPPATGATAAAAAPGAPAGPAGIPGSTAVPEPAGPTGTTGWSAPGGPGLNPSYSVDPSGDYGYNGQSGIPADAVGAAQGPFTTEAAAAAYWGAHYNPDGTPKTPTAATPIAPDVASLANALGSGSAPGSPPVTGTGGAFARLLA